MNQWFRFDRQDMYNVRSRLFDLGYVVRGQGNVDACKISGNLARLFHHSAEALKGWRGREVSMHEALALQPTDATHYNWEGEDGKMRSARNPDYVATAHSGFNIQSLPKIKVGDHIICSDSTVKPGDVVAVSHMSPWLDEEYDPTEEDMSESYDSSKTATLPKPPCRCSSLLGGHEEGCAWRPAPDERECEKDRLSRVWAIQQPKDAPDYATPSDIGLPPRRMGSWHGRW